MHRIEGSVRRLLGAAAIAAALAAPPAAAETAAAATVRHLICRMVDSAAAANGLPTGFLTRILWQESRFRPQAVSPKGAEGVAQFMPETAAERGLADPHDPGQAVIHAARFLIELEARFGNLGRAAAAYNAGPARVAKWLAGEAGLPTETRTYVAAVTGRPAERWAALGRRSRSHAAVGGLPCVAVTAELARAAPLPVAAAHDRREAAPHPPPMFQVRLDAGLAKAVDRLAAMQRQAEAAAVNSRPAPTRVHTAVNELCGTVRALGAHCTVYDR